jgi:hypothetical protein
MEFEYRMAEDHYERLPALANDLVRRRVAVIFTAGNVPPAVAAKAATQAVPIVFNIGADPVMALCRLGLGDYLNLEIDRKVESIGLLTLTSRHDPL